MLLEPLLCLCSCMLGPGGDAEACPGELSPALSRAPSHRAPCLPPGEPPKPPQPHSYEGLEQTAQAHAEVPERMVPIR